jgi:hypothetical protein
VRLGLNLTATITADVYLRISKRASGGTKTLIGDCLLSNQTITGTTATYTFPGTNLGSMSFTTGDKLCFNYQLNVLTNTNGLTGWLARLVSRTLPTRDSPPLKWSLLASRLVAGEQRRCSPVCLSASHERTPHAFRVTMIGSNIVFLMDGNALITVNDTTITSPGFAGLAQR